MRKSGYEDGLHILANNCFSPFDNTIVINLDLL